MKNKRISPCTEARYPEFPKMLFGVSGNGIMYFDAGHYIREKKKTETHSVENFKSAFGFWIRAVNEAYEQLPEDLFIKEPDTGNWLLEESLALLFAAYLDSGFAVYMLERISEMLTTGIVLSDTALLAMARERLTKEDLTERKQINN
jgi:hypothetical protein